MASISNLSSVLRSSSSIAMEDSAQFLWGRSRLTYYVALAAVTLVAWLVQSRRHTSKIDVPFYKASKVKWIFSAESLVNDSYRKFRDRAYQIKATEGIQVLVTAEQLGELKRLPEDVLSATEAVDESLQSKYTKFSPGPNRDLLSTLVRTRFTQNLSKLVPQLREELQFIIADEFAACDDWTPVKWQPFSLRVIARLSGRAFVGPSLNRNEKWMDVSTDFAVHVFMACIKLQMFPEWARPVVQYFVTDIRKIQRDLDQATEMLEPIVAERRLEVEAPTADEPANDLMQWLLEALPESDKADTRVLANLELIVAAASIHTTNGMLCECMCDLAANPEAQQELREEAHQILEVEGGWAIKESMAKLKKLDSFMREVQRLRGNITSFIRKVKKPITLSDGTHLPAGTKVLAPQSGISRDERYFDDPDAFDALRFYKMRQESDEASNRWQFTSLSDTNANFGAGKHACPGRFFAGNEIKLVLAQFVLSYDIRLRPGKERPKSMAVVMTKSPSPDVELEFRRRPLEA